jgi:hypothetical protein
MQTTPLNINFSIFDKKFIPEFITQNEHSHLVEIIQELDGDEFWPNQYKSPNKVKKYLSKSIKFLKRKFTLKSYESKNTVIV